jgi:hypothetical protein
MTSYQKLKHITGASSGVWQFLEILRMDFLFFGNVLVRNSIRLAVKIGHLGGGMTIAQWLYRPYRLAAQDIASFFRTDKSKAEKQLAKGNSERKPGFKSPWGRQGFLRKPSER